MPAVIPNSSLPPIRVLMIDDTAVIAHLLARELNREFDIQLVGIARNIAKANEKIAELQPDLIILDIEISGLHDGQFVSQLVREGNHPIIVLTSKTPEGASKAMDALTAGAIDVVSKPGKGLLIDHVVASLIERIRAARGISVSPVTAKATKSQKAGRAVCGDNETILAIGVRSGGLESLGEVLTHLPTSSPGAVIVQYLPAGMTSLLAERLNDVCDIEVKEAVSGDAVFPGRALIAPGGHHMLLRRSATGYFVQIKDGPEVFHQKPSVDVLFNSVAKHAGDHGVGAILCGTGSDGAQGLLNMRKAGGHTLAADDKLVSPDGVERIVPLKEVARAMLEMATHRLAVQ